jgi:molecular chaperone GrpE (heat shock protein)
MEERKLNPESELAPHWTLEQAADPQATLLADHASTLTELCRLGAELQKRERQAHLEKKALLGQLLEVLDLYDRYFANIEPKERDADRQTRVWLDYFRATRRKLERVLEKAGVSRIEAPGGKAVPGLHTVVDTVERPDLEEDTIVEEREKGYLWNGEPLRTASVVTATNVPRTSQ